MKASKKNVADLLVNIPEGTSWLIEFANLEREKGKLNPPTQETIERLKRPPEYKGDKKVVEHSKSLVDEKLQLWEWDNNKKEHKFEGIVAKSPFLLQEFKKLFVKKGFLHINRKKSRK